ncbi:MAG: hypothetical protein RQ847_05030 [Wenzhouxiangellaceae bacterium]|nr:hypothetical protein [Wenzhouxiangellaceae bacterium]
MKYAIAWLPALVLALFPAHEATGQEAPETTLMTVYELHVKIGHDRQFREAMAEWKKCYLENDGKTGWGVWRRVQGKGSAYAVTFNSSGWADWASDDPAGEACESIITDRIDPHLDGVATEIARLMPEISGSVDEFSVVNVINFRVADRATFNRIVKDVTTVLREDEHDYHAFWYQPVGGGPHAPDYFVVATIKDFAAMDEDTPGVWERYAAAKGQDAADKTRAEFGKALEDEWSYLYRRVEDLSHQVEE